jgi:hypothetical protein
MQAGNYYGLVELGDAISVWVQCSDSNNAPASPDSAPTSIVYGPDGTVITTSGAGTQTDSKTGFYRRSITASGGNGYERGTTYQVRWAWQVSTADRIATGSFTVT